MSSAVVNRITTRISEAQRIGENQHITQQLPNRIAGWKDHYLSAFGHLILEDVILVTQDNKCDVLHVFLFENRLICCKSGNSPAPLSKENTSLILVWCIYMTNFTKAISTPISQSTGV